MIEQADTRIVAWIKEVLGDVEVTLAPPGSHGNSDSVNCYLLALTDSPLIRAVPSTPLRLELRYLITTYAGEILRAHRMLGQLALASVDHPDWVRDLEPLPADLWLAFGVAPQPALMLRVPLRWDRPEPTTIRVTTPLEIRLGMVGKFQGVLLGPGEQPLAFASVGLPELGLSTTTDLDGRFCFAAVPLEPGTQHLLIHTKGQAFDLEVEQHPTDDKEVEIHL